MMMDEAYGKVYKEHFANLANTVGFDIIVQTVQDGIDSGQLAAADPRLVALSMWAGVHGLVSLLIVKQGLTLPPLDELLDNFCARRSMGCARDSQRQRAERVRGETKLIAVR
jgi:hypothetical protein